MTRTACTHPASFALALLLCAGSARGQTVMDHLVGKGPVDHFGQAVASAGDVDGDGLPDLLIGAPFDDTAAGANSGSVWIYSGADRSLIRALQGSSAGALFGFAVANAGDVDGDGVDDQIVGAPLEGTAMGLTGSAYVYAGATGLPIHKLPGEAAGDWFGAAVTGLDDQDGDGHAEFAVGAPFHDAGGTDAGRVLVFAGATGVSLAKLDGAAQERLGNALDHAGDLNGDGNGELAIGAPGAGAGATSPGYVLLALGKSWTPLATLVGDDPLDFFGRSLASIGDLDGDGVGELLVGAEGDDDAGLQAGGARLFDGATRSVLGTFPGPVAGALAGRSVAGAGDLDDDGVPDFLVGAPEDGTAGLLAGSARAYSGATFGVLFLVHGAPDDRMGMDVSTAGDVNADGHDDFLVGASFEDADQPDAGAVWLFSGQECPVMTFCTAKVNSLGCTPQIGWSGLALASGGTDQFHIDATGVLSGHKGILIWSFGAASIPFGGGTLCLAPPVHRTAVQSSGGAAPPLHDCGGQYSFHLSQAYMAANGITGGTTIYAQFWSRDTGFPPPNGIGLTDGLRLHVCP